MLQENDENEDYRQAKQENFQLILDMYPKIEYNLDAFFEKFVYFNSIFSKFHESTIELFRNLNLKFNINEDSVDFPSSIQNYDDICYKFHIFFQNFIFQKLENQEIEEIQNMFQALIMANLFFVRFNPENIRKYPVLAILQKNILNDEKNVLNVLFDDPSEFPPYLFHWHFYQSLIIDLTRVFYTQRTLTESLIELQTQIEEQEIILRNPNPEIINEFDIFQRLLGVFTKTKDYYNNFYRNFKNDAEPIVELTDEIKYFVEEITDILINEIPKITSKMSHKRKKLSSFEQELFILKQIKKNSTLYNDFYKLFTKESIQSDLSYDTIFPLFKNIEYNTQLLCNKINDINIDDINMILDQNQQFLKELSKQLPILIKLNSNKLKYIKEINSRLNWKLQHLIDPYETNIEKQSSIFLQFQQKQKERDDKIDNAINMIQYYDNQIGLSLSDFSAAITHIPFISNDLLADDCVRLIASSIPSYMFLLNNANEYRNSISEKEREIDDVRNKIKLLKEHTEQMDYFVSFHNQEKDNPNKCPNCVLEPLYSLPCGHTFCEKCLTSNEQGYYCHYCNAFFDSCIEIQW